MLGSCDGCPSSSVTLTLAVETAIRAAAPEVTGIEVEEHRRSGRPSVIPVSALRSRLDGRARRAVTWTPVDGLAELAAGRDRPVRRRGHGRRRRAGSATTCTPTATAAPSAAAAWRTARSSAGSAAAAGDAVLRCPACRAHFDVRRAGAGLDGTDDHLEPVPLLVAGRRRSAGRAGAVSA